MLRYPFTPQFCLYHHPVIFENDRIELDRCCGLLEIIWVLILGMSLTHDAWPFLVLRCRGEAGVFVFSRYIGMAVRLPRAFAVDTA